MHEWQIEPYPKELHLESRAIKVVRYPSHLQADLSEYHLISPGNGIAYYRNESAQTFAMIPEELDGELNEYFPGEIFEPNLSLALCYVSRGTHVTTFFIKNGFNFSTFDLKDTTPTNPTLPRITFFHEGWMFKIEETRFFMGKPQNYLSIE